MKIIYDDKDCADADGNRSIKTKHYEMEDTKEEREDIAALLYKMVIVDQSVTYGKVEINYQEITIEVVVEDYYPEIWDLVWSRRDVIFDEIKDLGRDMLIKSREELKNAKKRAQ